MIILTLLILGVCFGSFINALVWRVHEQDTRGKGKKSKNGLKKLDLSIVHGRSMCPYCKHLLAAKDLIPVLSWLCLKGKCRYCKAPIGDTPIPELLVPFLFIISYIYWPHSWNNQTTMVFGFWLLFLVGLVALAIYDLKWFLLPNRILFPLAGLAILQIALQFVFFGGALGLASSALWGLAFGGGVFWLLFQVSQGKWIGGGDVKLGWLIGLLLGGPLMSLLMIFIASLLGTLVSLPLLVTSKAGAKTRIPFGPFLIASAIIVRLFGAGMILWYKRQAGLY